jgi:hypothetical protein
LESNPNFSISSVLSKEGLIQISFSENKEIKVKNGEAIIINDEYVFLEDK